MKKTTENKTLKKNKIKRHGIHSKKKTSSLKSSKNYNKKYIGQGR